jgi:hypothetical protein
MDLPPDCSEIRNVTYMNLQQVGLIGSLSNVDFSGLSALAQLNLSSNNLSGSLSFVCGLNLVVEVQLQNNQFSGPLPNCFASLQRLELFHVGSNVLNGALPPSLVESASLQKLLLSRNLFSGALPELSLLNLTVIDLSWNMLGGTLNLKKSLKVRQILASGCNFTTLELSEDLSRLEQVDMSHNSISHLPNLDMAFNMTFLSFDGNFLGNSLVTKNCVWMLPPSLKMLQMRNCNISGALLDVISCLPKEFPAVVDLSGNWIDCSCRTNRPDLPCTNVPSVSGSIDVRAQAVSESRKFTLGPTRFSDARVPFPDQHFICSQIIQLSQFPIYLDPHLFDLKEANCSCELDYWGVPPNCVQCDSLAFHTQFLTECSGERAVLPPAFSPSWFFPNSTFAGLDACRVFWNVSLQSSCSGLNFFWALRSN